MSVGNPNKVIEMVTHLGTHLFIKDNSNVCTMLLITLFKSVSNCYTLIINHRLSYSYFYS